MSVFALAIASSIVPTKLTLHIVSPDTSISQDVDYVSLPGVEGDFGVLPGHTPFFTTLRPGTMWYRTGVEKHVLMVAMGFVEVLPDSGIQLITDIRNNQPIYRAPLNANAAITTASRLQRSSKP